MERNHDQSENQILNKGVQENSLLWQHSYEEIVRRKSMQRVYKELNTDFNTINVNSLPHKITIAEFLNLNRLKSNELNHPLADQDIYVLNIREDKGAKIYKYLYNL